jgi:hypothetical protein
VKQEVIKVKETVKEAVKVKEIDKSDPIVIKAPEPKKLEIITAPKIQVITPKSEPELEEDEVPFKALIPVK